MKYEESQMTTCVSPLAPQKTFLPIFRLIYRGGSCIHLMTRESRRIIYTPLHCFLSSCWPPHTRWGHLCYLLVLWEYPNPENNHLVFGSAHFKNVGKKGKSHWYFIRIHPTCRRMTTNLLLQLLAAYCYV